MPVTDSKLLICMFLQSRILGTNSTCTRCSNRMNSRIRIGKWGLNSSNYISIEYNFKFRASAFNILESQVGAVP